MTRPFDVELPMKASAVQISGCVATLFRLLGWELGEKYDAYMRPRFGETWLHELRMARLQNHSRAAIYQWPLKLHDLSFCLWEPAKNGDSPLRATLPATPGLYDLMDDVRKLRNKDAHEFPTPTLEYLDKVAARIGQLASAAQLPLAADCEAVSVRVQDLKSGAPLVSDDLAEIIAQKEAHAWKSRGLAADVAKLRARLKEKAAAADLGVAANQQLRAQLAAMEAARAAAEEMTTRLQAELEKQLADQRAQRQNVDVSGLEPGDSWPFGAPEGRALRLLTRVCDLYDPASVDLLSNEVGQAAVTAAALWRRFLPHGGIVVMTEAGHGVAMRGATWTYLGSLDADGEPAPALVT